MGVNFNLEVGFPKESTTVFWSGYASGNVISIASEGTPVPLTQVAGNILTYDDTDNSVVITVPGIYKIQFGVTTAMLGRTQVALYRNGEALPSLTCNMGTSANVFSGDTVIQLDTDDRLQLTLFGQNSSATLTGGAGATLTVIRLS